MALPMGSPDGTAAGEFTMGLPSRREGVRDPLRAAAPLIVNSSRMGNAASQERLADITDRGVLSSPRGHAALGIDASLSGAAGDEVWRVKRRVLREPIVPIEETLKKRRGLQLSMSSPSLFGEAPALPTDEKPNSRRGRRKNMAAQNMAATWTCTEGSSLLQSCMRFCAWEASLSPSGVPSNMTLLPSKEAGATGMPATSGSSAGFAALRKQPLPADIVGRIRNRGWTQPQGSSNVWVQQARELASAARASNAPATAGYRAVHERLQLLEHLEQEVVPQGLEALRAALRWRCSSIERAFACLDVGARNGRGGLTLFEMVAGLALLGLDTPALCGIDEVEAFHKLDADGDGRLGLLDLLSGVARTKLEDDGDEAAGPDHGNSSSDAKEAGKYHSSNTACAGRWALAAKFVALTAWFQTPVAVRRRQRTGSSAAQATMLSRAQPTGLGAAPAAISVVAAVADGVTGRVGERAALARQQANDPVRSVWAPSESDMLKTRQALQAEFNKHATTQQFNERLLSKSDLYRLLGEFPPSGIGEDPAAARLTRTELSAIVDEVISMQAEHSQQQKSCALSKGLTFESLQLVLFKASLVMDLNLRHLVDDAIEAQVQALTGAS